MAAAETSRAANPTLQDMLDQLAADATLPAQRRQDLASALRQVGRLLDLPLTAIPAHPEYLRQRLERANPAAAGLSKRRWTNILSLLRAALKHAGLSHVPGRYREPLTPEWDRLCRSINNRATRHGISRLASYCSGAGIVPEQVDAVVLASFHSAITQNGIVRRPREVHRVACKSWNEVHASREIGAAVPVPDYRPSCSLPWSAFPPALKQSVDGFLERLARKDLLEDLDYRPLRASSIAMRERQLRQFASALVQSGYPPERLTSIADLVTPEAFKDGLRILLRRNGDKPSRSIHNLACALRVVARHAVKVPAADLDRMNKICRNLDPGGAGLTDKNRTILRQFDDEDNLAALLHLPQAMLAEAHRFARPTRAAALLVQIALAIEMLLMVALRISNLAGLENERHFLYPRRGVRGGRRLLVPAEEVKNRIPIEAPLPPPLMKLMDIYQQTYRPLLLDGPSPYLFPGENGRPKGRGVFGKQISRAIRERTGLVVTPHAFRHILAKIGLREEPGNFGMMRLVLAHARTGTIERNYSGTEGPAAVQHFDAHVLRLREQLADPLAGRRGRRKGKRNGRR